MQRDRLPRRPALLEVVPLQDPGDRHAGAQPHDPFGAEGREPAAVEFDRRFLWIEDREGLFGVRGSVLFDFGAGQLRARRLLSRWVADHPGEVAHDENDAVARVLEVLHLADHDRVAEVDVGRGRVKSHLDRQGPARDLAGEVVLLDQIDCAALEEGDLVGDGSHGG